MAHQFIDEAAWLIDDFGPARVLVDTLLHVVGPEELHHRLSERLLLITIIARLFVSTKSDSCLSLTFFATMVALCNYNHKK